MRITLRWPPAFRQRPHLKTGLAWCVVTSALVCLALLLFGSGAPAQAPDPSIFAPNPPAASEPITPIPSAPPADPLRLALGERLFADPLLSHDGKHACTSCHDVHTNGASANRR